MNWIDLTTIPSLLTQLPYQDLLAFVGFFLIIWLGLLGLKWVVVSQLNRFTQSNSQLAVVINRLTQVWGGAVLLFLALYLALQFVAIPTQINQFLTTTVIVIMGWYLVRTIQVGIEFSFNRVIEKRKQTTENFDATILELLKSVTKVAVWILVALMVLQNLGVQVTALIGGLGIGGLAVAFAVQNLLGDVFSSISIYFDKPFTLGDFIVVGNDMGTVSHIGMKSTRLKTLQGEELVIPNKALTESRIHNYKKLQRRRVVFQVGVEYETPQPKLEKIPQSIKKIIEGMPDVAFDRAHLNKFGDWSLNFEIVYYLEKSDYNFYMDTQQAINLQLIKQFQKDKIGFAYPVTRVLK